MGPGNKELVRRFHEAAWNEGDFEAAMQVLADDLGDHDSLDFPGRETGARGLMQVVEIIRGAIPDLHRTIEMQIEEGDLVATRFTDRGTHEGDLLGVPPTGKTVTVTGMNLERVRDGKIAEVWHVEDLLGLMRQIGAIPVG